MAHTLPIPFGSNLVMPLMGPWIKGTPESLEASNIKPFLGTKILQERLTLADPADLWSHHNDISRELGCKDQTREHVSYCLIKCPGRPQLILF